MPGNGPENACDCLTPLVVRNFVAPYVLQLPRMRARMTVNGPSTASGGGAMLTGTSMPELARRATDARRYAAKPPSTFRLAPVTKLASGPAR